MTPEHELPGKVIANIEGLRKQSEAVYISTECDKVYMFYHMQSCCEDVRLEDYELDSDLIGATILSVEVNSNESYSNAYDSATWTYYKIKTTKGELTMRWYGQSNGYYSEKVDFKRIFTMEIRK